MTEVHGEITLSDIWVSESHGQESSQELFTFGSNWILLLTFARCFAVPTFVLQSIKSLNDHYWVCAQC